MAERPQNKNLRRGGPGRKPGQVNQRTLAIREAATAFVEDPAYRESLKRRLKAGKAPHMETLLHHYAYGKPVERHEITGADQGPLRIELCWDEYADNPGEGPTTA